MTSRESPVRPTLPLAEASRRLRRPAGRPRLGPTPGSAIHGAGVAPAVDAGSARDRALSVPPRDWPRGLSVPDAAEYSGLPTRAIWRLVASGGLPAVRVPGVRRVLVLRDDLDTLLTAYRTPGPGERRG